MKKLLACCLAFSALGAYAAEGDGFKAHVLAIKTQNTLNDLSAKVISLEEMADQATFARTKKLIDQRTALWPEETSATEPYRPCKAALESASYVASLTRMKATSSLEEKVWMLERGKLDSKRAACNNAVRLTSIK